MDGILLFLFFSELFIRYLVKIQNPDPEISPAVVPTPGPPVRYAYRNSVETPSSGRGVIPRSLKVNATNQQKQNQLHKSEEDDDDEEEGKEDC